MYHSVILKVSRFIPTELLFLSKLINLVFKIGKKGFEVLVQGGVIDDLARHLVEQCGIHKRYIEVLDKTKK